METQPSIVAVITTNPDKMTGGGAPVFTAASKEELQSMSFSLEKIMDASAHELNEETMIIVAR